MFFTPTHYGKKVDTLNEKEKELFTIDTIMTTIMLKKKEDGLDRIEEIILGQLTHKRTDLVIEIMGFNLGQTDEEKRQTLERIETTRFGYKKFIHDMNLNVKEHDRQERISQLN
jgi:hypothetical protein